MSGLKLGIVRLGKAAGKTKYALLDEVDISLAEHYAFEARLDIDANGCGARVYAWSYKISEGRTSGKYLHQLLWERHHGGAVPEGYRVVHSNGITMDNRSDNLAITATGAAASVAPAQSSVPARGGGGGGRHHGAATAGTGDPLQSSAVTSSGKKAAVASATQTVVAATPSSLEHTLYYLAIQQLPPDPLDVETGHNLREAIVTKLYNADGEVIPDEGDVSCGGGGAGVVYYECRYSACSAVERWVGEFSMCGRCREARYCGARCQQRHWGRHRAQCREPSHPAAPHHHHAHRTHPYPAPQPRTAAPHTPAEAHMDYCMPGR